jgi:TolA-binding protein
MLLILKRSILIILCILGCVYYNTFYNAKDYYNRAIKSNPPNKEFLTKAIQKCEKIIKYHPHSKYVPDALFLMGKCFLAKEEYSYAIQKFQELITYYPNHKLVDASRLELAKTYIESENYIEAMNVLRKIEKNEEETMKLTMDSYFCGKEYESVIDIGKEFISKFPKSKLMVEVLTSIGVSYDSLGKYDSAFKYYEKALKVSPKKSKLLFTISRTLIKLKEYEKARKRLFPLREIVSEEEKKELELIIAECYKKEGKFKKAIEILENLDDSPHAWYEKGIIYEEIFSDLEKAQECYAKVRDIGRDSDIINKALMRSTRIGKLTQYREKIQDTAVVEDLAKTQFLLAELYWLEFNKITEAIKEYENLIQNFPQSEYAAKSAYSIGWLFEKKLKDKEKAIKAYERVEKEYPESKYAEFSRERRLRLLSQEPK